MNTKPLIAIVGKPNVGKSTFFNKIVGERISIVSNVPGVTRDRIYADAEWLDRRFTLIDTGGIQLKSEDLMHKHIKKQAELAMDIADVILFFVDGKTGLTSEDREVASLLHKTGKPVFLAVNKVDNFLSFDISEFYSLGFDAYPISAEHKQGIGDLLDAVIERFPAASEDGEEEDTIKIAVVGKPNAGKSSLLSLVSGSEVMARDMLFATLDTTTRKIELPNGQPLLLTDTVGFIRNLPHRLVEAFKSTLEEAVLADFLVQVVDASDPEAVRHYETTLEVLGELGAGDKPMIVVLNKLDLVPEEERAALTERLAPHFNGSLVCMSVREGQGTEDLLRACVEMLESRVRRARFLIPYTRSDLAAAMHSEGMVISTEYVEEGALVEAVLPVAFYNKVSQFLAEPSCEE